MVAAKGGDSVGERYGASAVKLTIDCGRRVGAAQPIGKEQSATTKPPSHHSTHTSLSGGPTRTCSLTLHAPPIVPDDHPIDTNSSLTWRSIHSTNHQAYSPRLCLFIRFTSHSCSVSRRVTTSPPRAFPHRFPLLKHRSLLNMVSPQSRFGLRCASAPISHDNTRDRVRSLQRQPSVASCTPSWLSRANGSMY